MEIFEHFFMIFSHMVENNERNSRTFPLNYLSCLFYIFKPQDAIFRSLFYTSFFKVAHYFWSHLSFKAKGHGVFLNYLYDFKSQNIGIQEISLLSLQFLHSFKFSIEISK